MHRPSGQVLRMKAVMPVSDRIETASDRVEEYVPDEKKLIPASCA